jgi:hypothetical protein
MCDGVILSFFLARYLSGLGPINFQPMRCHVKGVEQDDEFYGVEFSQVSDDGVREVFPLTYALMTWWKVRMENQDTIDISEDSLSSMLRYESGYEAGEDENYLDDGDEIGFDNIIEVDEERKLVTLFSYVPKPIPTVLVPEVFASIIKINPHLIYGHFEAYKPESESDEGSYFLRYKVSTFLHGVKLGKVDVIDALVLSAQENLHFGVDLFAADDDVHAWLTE